MILYMKAIILDVSFRFKPLLSDVAFHIYFGKSQ